MSQDIPSNFGHTSQFGWKCDNCSTVNVCSATDCRWCGMDKLQQQARRSQVGALASFAALFLDEETADVRFQVAGEYIPAHKVVIAARSQYFRTMLYGEMKESGNNNNIVIVGSNVTPTAFRQVLRYLYSGDPGILSETQAMSLLACADMYQLSELQEICEYRLERMLDGNNVLPMLRLCLDLPHAKHLQECVLDFVNRQALDQHLIAECVDSFQEPGDLPVGIKLVLQTASSAPTTTLPKNYAYAAAHWTP